MEISVNYKKLNPVAFYLLHYMNDATIRYIYNRGGSSSGKSYSEAQSILIQTLIDGEDTLIMRKVGASIEKTIYKDFSTACTGLNLSKLFKFKQNSIVCLTGGAKIDFCGLDNPEKIKGISQYKRVVLEELTEFDEQDLKQVRLRLRGKKGQQIIGSFNPISEMHWIKKHVYDREKWHDIPMTTDIFGKPVPETITKVKTIRLNEPKKSIYIRTGEVTEKPSNTVDIQSTYLNNYWVVGSPDGTYGFYDDQCIANFEADKVSDPDYYNIYALGEWGIIRTGSEFLGSFVMSRDVRPVPYDNGIPVHLSVDNNVLPYITLTWWQFSAGQVRQIHEITAENPNNTVRRSAHLASKYLRKIGYDGKLYLHGDASAKAANTIDEQKRSFMDLFIETLCGDGVDVVDVVGNKNPSVPISGEFVNAILDGQIKDCSIVIDEKCHVSVEDYASVQKDVNGAILKTKIKNKMTGQTYEEHGHITDTMRYVVCDLLREEFTRFSNRRKRNRYAQDGYIKFFNSDAGNVYTDRLVYASPNIDGMFVLIDAARCGDRFHILGISYRETASVEEVSRDIERSQSSDVVIECGESYYQYVRQLRESSEKTIRVMPEPSNAEDRITATTDFVRSSILFKMTDDEQYQDFMDALLDYNKDSQTRQAAVILSGFCQYVIKSII